MVPIELKSPNRPPRCTKATRDSRQITQTTAASCCKCLRKRRPTIGTRSAHWKVEVCQKLGELLTEFKIPNIPVQKAVEEKALPPTWINELQGFSAQVGQKAFELFEKYGQPAGRQMEHWFEAEK